MSVDIPGDRVPAQSQVAQKVLIYVHVHVSLRADTIILRLTCNWHMSVTMPNYAFNLD